MPWWNRGDKELPERLRDKSAEEIEQAVADGDALRTRNAALETQLGETNTRFETFTTQTNQQLAALNARLAPPENRQANDPTSFLVDGDKAFAERIGPLYNMVLSTAEVNARQEALRQAQNRQRTIKNNIDGMLFDKFETEIAELAKGCTPQQRAMPDTWTHLFYNVKGRHGDVIAEHNREHKGDFFVENVAERARNADDVNKDQLTPLEESIARKMGVSKENYLKQKKEMSTTGIPAELGAR